MVNSSTSDFFDHAILNLYLLMPSLVANFECDIFISYRHNDNRSGWVTEFVQHLNEELAATIKDSVSVYFDSNPHDGLLETHHVEKSLEGKLKCIIFIPILSQTYCDPKSFAWQHEFCAFNKMTKQDQFGANVRLHSGNVASRILPIKIHNLDSEDAALIEKEIGGPLRAIELIYTQPGVNRPLKPADSKIENQNKTDYRNQINRVAYAIREIIQALLKPLSHQSASIAVKSKFEIEKKSIAVLPFANLSSDPEQEYFSDGITEDIITQISKIHELKVISRTSIAQYKKSEKSSTEIGAELKVAFLLEGSVRKAGNKLRITAQLINASADEHMWAETYDRELTDIFSIQTEIAQNVASELKAKLTAAEQSRISKKPTDNIEAYNLYLLGRSHYHKATPEDFAKAIECYNQAITLDKNFALGYASLAMAVVYRGAGYFGIRPHDAMPEAFRLANKAIELDSTLSEAYTARAEIHDWYFYDWSKAEIDYQRALGLNPNNGTAHLYKALHLVACRRYDEAMTERAIAFELDPHSLLIRVNGFWIPMLGGYPEQSLDEVRAQMLHEPPNFVTCFCRGLFASQLNFATESVENFREASKLAANTEFATFCKIMLAYGLARANQSDEAREILNEIHTLEKKEFIWPLGIALAYAHLNELTKATEYFQKSYEERVGWMLWIGVDPFMDILRGEIQFKKIAQKIGPNE